mgnify:CR=1 FL=1
MLPTGVISASNSGFRLGGSASDVRRLPALERLDSLDVVEEPDDPIATTSSDVVLERDGDPVAICLYNMTPSFNAFNLLGHGHNYTKCLTL